MSKQNRIPTWDLVDSYPENIRSVVESLIALSDRDYQIRVWVRGEGPEHDFYYERELIFDEHIEFFKDDLRKGKLKLSPEQIKAILRVHAMMNYFDGIPWREFTPPNNPYHHLYLIHHPYWKKIQKQAAHALKLLKSGCTDELPGLR